MKILIVDDDPVSREVLRKIVTNDPAHQATTAVDATSAWTLLDDPSRYFDVAFLDLSMPDVSGFQLLHRIRSNPVLANLEIIICTGSKERDSIAKAVQLGARHYMVKPCTEAVVQAKLQQIAGPRRSSERRLAGAA
jgi:CheY-like chemotaxis protein